jgi:hypothetical protein
MPNTPVYTTGVKYIKIAKQDSGSVDNSIELQNLTDIRIKFSDINNAVQYNVASITEYSTYYLYGIVPLNITSSADQEILDYKVSASSNNITSVGGTFPSSFVRITDYIKPERLKNPSMGSSPRNVFTRDMAGATPDNSYAVEYWKGCTNSFYKVSSETMKQNFIKNVDALRTAARSSDMNTIMRIFSNSN